MSGIEPLGIRGGGNGCVELGCDEGGNSGPVGDVRRPPIPTGSEFDKAIERTGPDSVFSGPPGDGGRPNGFEGGLPFLVTLVPSAPRGGERADELSEGGGGSCIPVGGRVGECMGPGKPPPMPEGLICGAWAPFV